MEICLSEVVLLKLWKSDPDLRNDKLLFLSIYFLIRFKGLIVKISFSSDLKSFFYA